MISHKQLLIILPMFIVFSMYSRPFSGTVNAYDVPEKAISITKTSFKPYPENRVHRAGNLWLNMTNCGYFGNFIGSDEPMLDPCTQKVAPSREMQGGTGTSYMLESRH